MNLAQLLKKKALLEGDGQGLRLPDSWSIR
jgi:hypothetical protein